MFGCCVLSPPVFPPHRDHFWTPLVTRTVTQKLALSLGRYGGALPAGALSPPVTRVHDQLGGAAGRDRLTQNATSAPRRSLRFSPQGVLRISGCVRRSARCTERLQPPRCRRTQHCTVGRRAGGEPPVKPTDGGRREARVHSEAATEAPFALRLRFLVCYQ